MQELTKLQVGFKSALRAFIPAVTTLLLLVSSGQLSGFHTWQDFVSVKVLAVLAAVGVKGIHAGVTAQDVTVAKSS